MNFNEYVKIEHAIRIFRNDVFDGEDERLLFDEEYFEEWLKRNLIIEKDEI